eukprot:CAMPEP_0206543022 /NCGR_PEP_ID=MMETSP0325_2-20121206/10557_1 /ASSEMBLY_ACC=CAM_ASM_000347 /TAXON_ID=2866 /ORGANISM="Crypthecodinium cohnii, Strain Seligo" /LENGTH=552 /DNA_ID=CAMNT_0054041265 /DNA_START=92 /DNA_END=1750 /DNA_ORIENTATION=+
MSTASSSTAGPPLPGVALRGGGGVVETLVESLRRTQENTGAGNFIAAAGVVLILSGSCWGSYWLFTTFPFLLCIVVGFKLLFIALLMRPSGVLSMLPREVQDFLLRKTIFDLLFDDSNMQNMVRKWIRMLLLCYGRWSPADIRALLAGLDPQFVDFAFRRTMFQHLSGPLRLILLPSSRPAALPNTMAGPSGWPRGSVEENLQIAAAEGAGAVGLPSEFGGPPCTAQRIAISLQEKNQEKESKYTEPPLSSAMFAVYGIKPTILRWAESALTQTRNVLAVGALLGGFSALLLYLPWTRDQVAKGLGKLPWKEALHIQDGGRAIVRSRQGVSLMATISAGGCVIAALISSKLSSLREVLSVASTTSTTSIDSPKDSEEEFDHHREHELKKRINELEAKIREQAVQHEVEKEATFAELRSRHARSEAENRELRALLEKDKINGKPTNGKVGSRHNSSSNLLRNSSTASSIQSTSNNNSNSNNNNSNNNNNNGGGGSSTTNSGVSSHETADAAQLRAKVEALQESILPGPAALPQRTPESLRQRVGGGGLEVDKD